MNRAWRLSLLPACLLLVFVPGLASQGEQSVASDLSAKVVTGYPLKGNLEPLPGQVFPREWGRLVNYLAASGDGGFRDERFVFEDARGTIRIVDIDLNWRKFKVDDAKVLTIGRR